MSFHCIRFNLTEVFIFLRPPMHGICFSSSCINVIPNNVIVNVNNLITYSYGKHDKTESKKHIMQQNETSWKLQLI